MRIAQIASLSERVPPKLYGGTERVVCYLAEELVRQGHEVTLFASGDSITQAELVPCCDTALRLDPAVKDTLPYQIVQLEKVRQRADEFDVLHFHNDFLHFPLFRSSAQLTLITLHGRLDLPDLQPFYIEFPEFPLVSISQAQRWPMPPVNWVGAGYWSEVIKPMVHQNPHVEFVGEIGEQQKVEFLGNALALLFPIDWPEPFGLVMIEAMSCGTPVVAFRLGSVPEVIEDGVSGVVVTSMDQAVDAVRKIGGLDRRSVWQAFERRFTAESMARQYLSIYQHLAGQHPSVPRQDNKGCCRGWPSQPTAPAAGASTALGRSIPDVT